MCIAASEIASRTIVIVPFVSEWSAASFCLAVRTEAPQSARELFD